MWMSVPTPVIRRTKVIDNWSSRKATSAWNPPTGTQLKRYEVSVRSSPERPSMSAKSTTPTAKDAAANAQPIQWPARSSRRPPVSSTPAPSSGARTSSPIRFSTLRYPSELHQAGVVDRGRVAGAEDRHDDRESHDHLGRGDDHREERDDLA